MQRLGEKIRTLRKRRGITSTELAHMLGYVSQGYISEVETGKKFPKTEFIVKIADLFGVTLDQLIRDELDV